MILLASLTFTFWWVNMSGIPARLKLPAKPFRCDICVPIYTTVAMWWAPDWVPSLISTAFGGAILAPFVRNFLHNVHAGARWFSK
jgi:hypothetical protein